MEAYTSKFFEKNWNRSKPSLVSFAAFALLYSELVKYCRDTSVNFDEMEKRYKLASLSSPINTKHVVIGTRVKQLGKEVGVRMLCTKFLREKWSKREANILNALYFVNDPFYKQIFGKTADSLEKSNEHDNEYMIIDLEPLVSKLIGHTKAHSGFSCSTMIAGMIEGCLFALGFRCSVSAHSQPLGESPTRTVFLIKVAHQSANS